MAHFFGDRRGKKEKWLCIVGYDQRQHLRLIGRLVVETDGYRIRSSDDLPNDIDKKKLLPWYLDQCREELSTDPNGHTNIINNQWFFGKIHQLIPRKSTIYHLLHCRKESVIAQLLIVHVGTGEINSVFRRHLKVCLRSFKQRELVIVVDGMESVGYKEDAFIGVKQRIVDFLSKSVWKSLITSVPIIPISSFLGDNVVQPSTNMPWWTGCTIDRTHVTSILVTTLLEALDISNDSDISADRDLPPRAVISMYSNNIYFTTLQGKFTASEKVKSLPNRGNGKWSWQEAPMKSSLFKTVPREGDIVVRSKDTSLKSTQKITALVYYCGTSPIVCPPNISVKAQFPELTLSLMLQNFNWYVDKKTKCKIFRAGNHLNPIPVFGSDCMMAEMEFFSNTCIVVDYAKKSMALGVFGLIFNDDNISMVCHVVPNYGRTSMFCMYLLVQQGRAMVCTNEDGEDLTLSLYKMLFVLPKDIFIAIVKYAYAP